MSNNLFVIERARPEEAAASALMDAITKNWISEEQIQQMTDRALGRPVVIKNIKKLSGGFFSAVYLVETAEEKMVLKLASGAEIKVMRHEVKYIPTEAEMLKLFQERLEAENRRHRRVLSMRLTKSGKRTLLRWKIRLSICTATRNH